MPWWSSTPGGTTINVPDGYDETQGLMGDAAWGGAGAGTIVSILKRIAAVAGGGSAAPTTLRNGQKAVAVTNTAVALAASTAISGVVVQALAGNVGNVVVGDSNVTTANGFQLQPGQATGIAIDDLEKIFVNGTAADGVCYVGG